MANSLRPTFFCSLAFACTAGILACSHQGGSSRRTDQSASTVASASSIRIAAGESTPYTDAQGNVWAADHSFTGGVAATDPSPVSIAGTDAPELYNSQRYGADSSFDPAPFHYTLAVSPGTYLVTLDFAEGYVTGPGQRRFNVVINGAVVLSEFDIYATAGAMNTAVDESFAVTVGSEGQVEIDFTPGSIQNPMVNAIAITPQTTVRIAAGESSPYKDPHGEVWSADNSFSGGISATTPTPVAIAGTDSPRLYNSQRYGADSTNAPAPFSYALTVSPGAYVVTLEFAEGYVTGPGQRRFSVAINGSTVLSEFDIYATAGSMNTAVDESFPISVGSSGQVSIDFTPGSIQNPMINAIAVAPAPAPVGGKDGGADGGTCMPTTCKAQGASCGTISDDCGGHVACGSCGSGESCTSNVCVSSSGMPITAPLTGEVTAGTWQAGDIVVPGVTLPSGLPFHYDYLLPANYDPSFTYPILVHEHEDYEGSAWYEGNDGDPLYLASASGADSWYNNPAWRTAYPCIVLLPYADQSSGGGDGDDALENFGGWTNAGIAGSATTNSGDTGPNVFAVAGLVEDFVKSYSVNANKVYITGDSLGGIGSWYMALMYNRVNGPSGKLFTAALPFAGVIEMNGFGNGPTAAQVSQLRNVPVFAVSGANDGTSLPQDWNQPLWQALAGNSSYPPPPSGAEAGSSSFNYMQDPALGHDVWDTYRVLPTGKPLYDWLFSQ
jgi:hypothetical protein